MNWAPRSLPSSPVKGNPRLHYPSSSVTQSSAAAYHHQRHLSHDMEDEDDEDDLYVNQRDLQEAVRLRQRRRGQGRRHRYEVMDGDEEDEDAFEYGLDDLGSRDELTPNFSSSQYSLNRTPLIQQPNGGAFQSQGWVRSSFEVV